MIDHVDLTIDLLPRLAVRALGGALPVGILLVLDITQGAVDWYTKHKAQQLVDSIINVQILDQSPHLPVP